MVLAYRAKAKAAFADTIAVQGKKYGEGGYGATYGAKDTESAAAPDVAVKVIDTRRMRKDAIMRETSILESLEHPNVIRVLAHGSGRAEVQRKNYVPKLR